MEEAKAATDAAETARDAEHGEPVKEKKAAKKGKKAQSSVSQDDITKIIVQKIKQDRSNSQKIGQILKTYGVSKVSEMPGLMYESFLTDLSAL